MFLKKQPEFSLKCHPAMVVPLVFDILRDLLQVGPADRKPGVSPLPGEPAVAGTLGLHPAGTRLLDLFDDFLQGVVLRQGE